MLKYILRIEGSAKEIEAAKTCKFDCFEDIPGFGDNPIEPEIEYHTHEPKYRVKSLGELAADYGIDITYNHGRGTISIKGFSCEMSFLGARCDTFATLIERPEGWRDIFLKEIL
jgi:hypothetical protein